MTIAKSFDKLSTNGSNANGQSRFIITSLFAQQKYPFSYTAPPEIIGKWVQRHIEDVGDAPGHLLGMSEIVTTYLADKPAPTYADVRVKESRAVQTGDTSNGTGIANGYAISLMENGDKLFFKVNIVNHASPTSDGKYSTSSYQVNTVVGGTGKFKNIRGTIRSSSLGYVVGTTMTGPKQEGEYYFID